MGEIWWNSTALRTERERRGLTVESMAKAMGGSVNTVRKVEGRIRVAGKLQMPTQRSVARYVEALNSNKAFDELSPIDFENAPLVLRTPDFVDFRPHKRVSNDPKDSSWRMSAVRIGVGPLDLEVNPNANIHVLDVRLGAEVLCRFMQDREPQGSPYDVGKYEFDHVLRLNHWCSWTGGSRSTRHNYGYLGLVNLEGVEADKPFKPPKQRFRQEAMFSPCPPHVKWGNFVRACAEEAVDLEFNLTVRYRADDGERTTGCKFAVSGETLQGYCRYAINKPGGRGLPAQMQPYIIGKVDPRPQPKLPTEL